MVLTSGFRLPVSDTQLQARTTFRRLSPRKAKGVHECDLVDEVLAACLFLLRFFRLNVVLRVRFWRILMLLFVIGDRLQLGASLNVFGQER